MKVIDKFNNLLSIRLTAEVSIVCILSFIIIYFFYLLIFVFAVNIPYWDDYNAILGFSDFFLLSNLHDKIALFFSQYNEHRIVLCRLLVLLSYYLTGKINFKLLTIIGDISLVGLLIVFLKSSVFSKDKNIPPRFIIPAVLLLFQPQYWETIIMSMAAISNLFVLFFAFLSVYLLTKQSMKYFIFSLLFAILATFTNGNGMFVFLIGLFFLIFQKRYKEIRSWALVGITCIWLYFLGYLKPLNHPSIAAAIFIHPVETMGYFFNFLGACSLNLIPTATQFSYRLTFLTGVLFSLYFAYLFKIKYYKINPAIFSFLSFLFISAAAVSLCRCGFGIYQSLASRYAIISVLCLISFYFSAIEILSQKITRYIFPILLLGAILFNLFSYHNSYGALASHKATLINASHHNNFELLYPFPSYAKLIMFIAKENGYYFFPVK